MRHPDHFLKLSVIISLLLPAAAYAQYPGAELEINSSNGVYAVGDSIKVWADITPESASVLEFCVEKNMNLIIKTETLELTAGRHLLYADICREPAHYVFMISKGKGKPETETTSTVGAIVSPEKFRSGYQAPKDLRKFWDGQIAKMRQMPLTVKERPAPKGKDDQTGMTCLDIEIPMPEGNPVRAYLAYPSGAGEKSLPIVIYAHAAGVKGGWCQCSIDDAIRDARKGNGAIALDINAHGMLNGQPQSYYEELEAGELKDYSTREFTGHEEFYFRLMYLRLVRALDYLVTLPQWDGKRVAIYGESQGGAQSAALAGMDERVTAALLRVPAFIDVAGTLDGRRGPWPRTYGKKARELEKELPYYDGACLLSLTKAKLYIEAGLVDYTCPPGCLSAGYNNAGSKDKTIVFFPYRPHHSAKMSREKQKRWEKEIYEPREKWLDDYLK